MNWKIRGIGFDLGETLIFYRDTPMNWSSLYLEALQSVAVHCHTSPSPDQFAAAEQILSRYKTRITPRTREVAAPEIFLEILRVWEIDPAENLSTAMEAFFTFFQQQMCPYPETTQVLASLRDRRLPVGILTDVPYGMPRELVERDIQRAGLDGLFDVLLTSVEIGLRKPEPTGYLVLASRLGVMPAEMLYIGNEPKDVIGARAAGCAAALLDRSKSGADHGQHFTLATLSELDGLLSSSARPSSTED